MGANLELSSSFELCIAVYGAVLAGNVQNKLEEFANSPQRATKVKVPSDRLVVKAAITSRVQPHRPFFTGRINQLSNTSSTVVLAYVNSIIFVMHLSQGNSIFVELLYFQFN